jgi:transcriptional regulator GlxA family with amidase domain
METLVRRLGRIFTLNNHDENRKMDRLQKALDWWMETASWRIPFRTLKEEADYLGTDSVTLFHYFEQRMKTDFRTWRNRLRLEDAKRMMLENPGASTAEIARRTGFSNRSNFSRQFLAYTGQTPAQWRKEARMSPDIPAPENDYV